MALRQLAREPDEQRAALAGTVVTDELALCLDDALRPLTPTSGPTEVDLDQNVHASLERLSRLLEAEPGDQLWDVTALDTHPIWAEARTLAREILLAIPSEGTPLGGTRSP